MVVAGVVLWIVGAVLVSAVMMSRFVDISSGRHVDQSELAAAAFIGMTWPAWLVIVAALSPALIGVLIGLRWVKRCKVGTNEPSPVVISEKLTPQDGDVLLARLRVDSDSWRRFRQVLKDWCGDKRIAVVELREAS
ncbi:MAG: hypothetical protein WC277_04525 [Bacilli bacterium]|jgi:hypothetical protein